MFVLASYTCRPVLARRLARVAQLDGHLHAYAELLYRWGALGARLRVLKRLAAPPRPPGGPTCVIVDDEAAAGEAVVSPLSPLSRLSRGRAVKCAVCELSVRSLLAVCSMCGHGGHPAHMRAWFRGHVSCPTGCGCRCNVHFEDAPEP